jgi:hypothetical protein
MTHAYAIGHGVRNVRVQTHDSTLAELRKQYRHPVQLPHKVEAYHAATKRERTAIKMELSYFVGGSINGKRHDSNVQARTLITLDIEAREKQDHPPPPEEVFDNLEGIGAEGWVYTSLSHTPEAPRYRVVLPLGEPITGDDLTEEVLRATTQAAAKKLGLLPWCTTESSVLSQPMYLPAKLKGGVFWEGYTGPGKHWRTVRAGPTEPRDVAPMPEGKADTVLHALRAAGLHLEEDKNHKGKHFIRCPFADQHGAVNDTQTVYYEAHHDGNPRPAVKCFDTEPDVDGRPHLTYGTLVRWLRDEGWLKQEDEATSEVMDEYEVFMDKASVGQYLHQEPVPREWAWEGFAPVGKVTVLAGPGGVSKSMLMLHLMVYGALGQSWAGFNVKGPLRSMYLSYEDDTQELHKRVHGLAAALRETEDGMADVLYDITGSLQKNLFLYAADDEALNWLLMKKADLRSTPERTARVEWLVGFIKHARLRAIVLDPVVYTHNLEESAPGDMAVYMQTLTYIAKAAGCAVIVLHHMHKTAAWASLEEVNQGSLRGASSFADNSRSVGVLISMPTKDAPRYGLSAGTAGKQFAVFKHVKHNYSAPLETQILERRGPLLVPRNDLDVLTPIELDARTSEQKARQKNAELESRCRSLIEWLEDGNSGSTINMARLALQTRHSLFKDMVVFAEENDWLHTAPGPNRSTVLTVTQEGKKWAKTAPLE